jgi:hypothetical protein
MAKVKIEKDIYVRDKYGVRRHAFMAGHEVDEGFYHSVLSTDTPVNPDDLPVAVSAEKASLRSVHAAPAEAEEPKAEVITSEDGAAVQRERVSEAEANAKAVEATAKVAEGEPTPAAQPKAEEVVAEAEDADAESEEKPQAKKSKKGNK